MPSEERPATNSSDTFIAAWHVQRQQAIEIFIRPPSCYFCKNLARVLPDWQRPPLWVVFTLQQATQSLARFTPPVQQEKDRLREQFLGFAQTVVRQLRDRGLASEAIDPRTGCPLFSRAGEIPHDDVAAVAASLQYPIAPGNCSLVIHPDWGTAVYPSTLMASAPREILEAIVREAACQQGWTLFPASIA